MCAADLTPEGTIPRDIFLKACVTSEEDAVTTAERVGYPIMIKASEGGGGKGIRMVKDPADLIQAYQQVDLLSLFHHNVVVNWPRGTGFSQLPSAVTSTVDH
jgi:carbamoylphosphate synthase large subunit